MTDDKLELRVEPGGREGYIPGIDGYLSIDAAGRVTVKKPEGQETFECRFWTGRPETEAIEGGEEYATYLRLWYALPRGERPRKLSPEEYRELLRQHSGIVETVCRDDRLLPALERRAEEMERLLCA